VSNWPVQLKWEALDFVHQFTDLYVTSKCIRSHVRKKCISDIYRVGFYFLSFFLEGLKEVKAILIGFALIEIDFVIFMYFFKYGRYYL
jgi:hypothetical protein